MEKFDVVYVLKNDIWKDEEELRYSVRSVEKNFPYNKICFYGGIPKTIKPDIMVPFTQNHNSKIMRAVQTFRIFFKDDQLTENIWLFNDDFFIMKPFTNFEPIYDNTLRDYAKQIYKQRKMKSRYTQYLEQSANFLETNGYEINNYATHTPFLINRKKGLFILENFFRQGFLFRCLYGNIYKIGGINQKDPKIIKINEKPDENIDLLSTNNKSFKSGLVGKFIKESFPNPSKYENLTNI